MSDGADWPARFELAAQPLHKPIFVVILLELAALVGGIGWLVVRFQAAGVSPPGRFWLQAVFLLVALAPMLVFVLARRRRPIAIEVTPDRVSMPALWTPGRLRDRPIGELRSALFVPSRRWPSLYFGFETGLPTSLRTSEFCDPDDALRLLAAVERAVAARPDGAARLARIERHRSLVARQRARRPWFVVGFVAGIALVFAATWLAGLGDPDRADVVLLHFGASENALVRAGEWHRLVTANLLHGNVAHFASNAVAIALLGLLLERQIGTARTAILGLASGIGGAALSHALRGDVASVGASTVAMGLWASWLLLLWRRRDELPHRAPAWALVAPIALALLGEFQLPNIDHAAHAGGALTGAVGMAIVLRGRDLAALAAPAPRAALLAIALACVYVVGAAIVARDVVGWSESRRHALTMRAFERGVADPALRNALAWDLARSPAASPEQLERARLALRRTSPPATSAANVLDTRARLAYRLDLVEEAVELQQLAYAERDERAIASRLAHYEWEKRQRDGASQRIGAARADVAISLDAARDGEAGERVIVVEIEDVPATALEVHAVALEGATLRGHLIVLLGPHASRSLRFADAHSIHNRWTDVRFEVTRIDATRDLPAADEWRWRLWRIDPDALAP